MTNTHVNSSIFHTLIRKLQKSIGQRGLWSTSVRCLKRPLFYLRSYLHEFSPETQRRRRIDLEFDETYRVDTRIDFDPGWLAEIDSPNWVHGRGYSPAPHHSLRKTLERIDIDFEQFTFIDFGSGKGRSLLVAAEYPFDQIIGVEYSHRLSEVAEKNFRTY